jgi:hypothetical protein
MIHGGLSSECLITLSHEPVGKHLGSASELLLTKL